MPPEYFSCNKNTTRYSCNTSSSFPTAERTFSTLRLIKLNLQATMGQACLDGLCLMYIQNYIAISTGAIIKKFAATSRKIKLQFLAALLSLTVVSNS